MGPTLNNLDKLLRLPFGCGEQNMIHFAPNVFVLKYLQKTRQLSPEVENEATDYLLQGKSKINRLINHYYCSLLYRSCYYTVSTVVVLISVTVITNPLFATITMETLIRGSM